VQQPQAHQVASNYPHGHLQFQSNQGARGQIIAINGGVQQSQANTGIQQAIPISLPVIIADEFSKI
jgi:hypothetical protein